MCPMRTALCGAGASTMRRGGKAQTVGGWAWVRSGGRAAVERHGAITSSCDLERFVQHQMRTAAVALALAGAGDLDAAPPSDPPAMIVADQRRVLVNAEQRQRRRQAAPHQREQRRWASIVMGQNEPLRRQPERVVEAPRPAQTEAWRNQLRAQ